MGKEIKVKYKIERSVLKNYIDTINSIKESMNRIKEQLNQPSKTAQEQLKNICAMSNAVKELSKKIS